VSAISTHSTVSNWKLGIPEYLGLLRSIGLGGLLGFLITYLISRKFPELIAGGANLQQILLIGSAFGICLHRLLNALIGLLRPIYDCVAYYALVAQLHFQTRGGLIDESDQKWIKRQLDYSYFLGVHKSGDDIDGPNQTSTFPNTQVQRKPAIKRPRAVTSLEVAQASKSIADISSD
jgi:hypothetical protein